MLSLSVTVTYFLRVMVILIYNFGGGSCNLEDIKDHFGSINNLTLLADSEQDIYNIFKKSYDQGDYDKEPSILKSALERYLADFEDSNGIHNGSRSEKRNNSFSITPEEVSSNPLLPYRMLYRIEKYRKVLETVGNVTFTLSDGSKANLWELVHINPEAIPTKNDVNEAMRSILRLHLIYELNLTEFTSGVIAGIKTNARLNAIHCYEIGVLASTLGYYDLSVEWFEMAYSKVYFESDSSVDQNAVNHALLESIIDHDAALNYDASHSGPPKISVYNNTLREEYHEPKKYPDSNNRINTRKVLEYETWEWPINSDFSGIHFWALCSGNNYQTEKVKSQLYCWLESGKSKINLISPSKIELLSKYPYIVQIYDFIGRKISNRIVMEAENWLMRSFVVNNNDTEPGRGGLSNERTSANTWLPTTKYTKDLIKIEKQIEFITGLKLNDDASEALQVASYVFGRHYDVHTDTLNSPMIADPSGDRMATFLIYLEEPLAGGLTAFIQAGIAAKPVKGSAVFWYNLFRNGSAMDDITWHGACPVLLGHKFVGNKWIRFGPQFLAAPCSLNQNDTIVNIL